ncbi:TonB-dependent receptor [uncultured Polaribacter sp.]|uniref:SusC/RagA family TonB-linked outer membrane protein n=1 Tax=uncultured Polaribacter sp. TaxID=174711 RepID=UPI002631987D|nr:TonB-dependent receptor [uncultured Polaribacter sp.]
MSFNILVMFAIILPLQASSSYSERTKVSLKLIDVPLEQIIKEIESKTDFKFVYKIENINLKRKISIDADKKEVKAVLEDIFSKSNTFFKVINKQIFLTKKDKNSNLKIPDIQEIKIISGTVTSIDGTPLPGVNILIKGSTTGTQTDFDGKYNIATKKGDILIFSYLGMETINKTVGDEKVIDIVMLEDAASLDEVVIVSFGKQKKNSMVASITTVKPEDIRVPSSNLTTGLLGQVAGLTGFQAGGEPGADNVAFFIRGITTFGFNQGPLILIDGVELTVEDLARIHPDDIAAFSIMKDATATALYGARGANGVVFITTKEGKEGPLKVNARIEYSTSQPTDNVEFADAVTYMNMHNEALTTRNPFGVELYSPRKIDNTIAGTNPLLYPVTDWMEELFKDYAINKRMNINLSGGGKKARYYVALGASQDTGILQVPEVNNYNSNIDLKRYMFRSNINLDLTETTELKLGFNANYVDYTGPIDGGAAVYNSVIATNPVLFRPFYEKDEANEFTDHILFGNADPNFPGAVSGNPYADVVSGYRENLESKIIAQLELSQDLKMITEGLSFKTILNITRASNYSINRGSNPYYYNPVLNIAADGTESIFLQQLNPDLQDNTLTLQGTSSSSIATTYFESRLTYNKTIKDKHDVTALAVYTLNNRLNSIDGTNLQTSLPFRNMGLSGRFTYAYDDRYLAELNFGYNGSERFAANERYGLFPAFGLGWVVSNESFMDGKIKDIFTRLKFRASYGFVGNDAIGDPNDRFFYLSEVNLSDGTQGYTFGQDFNVSTNGVSTNRYSNPLITWETSEKMNIGVEMKLFNKIDIEVDVFEERRSNILLETILPSSLGFEAEVLDNVGEARSYGIDGMLSYSQNFSNGMWIQGRANYTFATSEITKYSEPDYTATPWLSRVGQPINQQYGLIAERLFVDQAEVNNSPAQQFGDYGPGDIKYRDINGDGIISGLDAVPIGNQTSPEIVYGFGISTGYKGFDVSCFFQGLANRSFFINPVATAPFVGGKQLLKVWADDYWSENNRDPYARWPRLSDELIANNTQTSTWFLQDGAYLRLKNVEVGYTLPEKLVSKIGMQKIRFYATGQNLALWSTFKLWDVEMGGNGLSYPNQKVFNIGAQISL